jgi:hypothetical protein
MWSIVDATTDLGHQASYVHRERGSPKEQSLPYTKSLDGRARLWMIDPVWLLAHPEENVPNKVADSGKRWGNQDDPEDKLELIKTAAIDKKEMKRKKRTSDSTLVDEDEGGLSRKKAKKGKAKANSKKAPTKD